MGFWADVKAARERGHQEYLQEKAEKEAKEAEEKRKAEEERIAKEKAQAEAKARWNAMTPEERQAEQKKKNKERQWAWRANPMPPDWPRHNEAARNQMYHTFGTPEVDMVYKTYAPVMYGMLLEAAEGAEEIKEFRAEYRENQKKLENDIAEIKEKIEMLSEILSKMTESSMAKERKY